MVADLQLELPAPPARLAVPGEVRRGRCRALSGPASATAPPAATSGQRGESPEPQ
jgi:hypothetical protein